MQNDFFGGVLAILALSFFACRKSDAKNPCDGVLPVKAAILFKENLSDTAFAADTVFQDNSVTFESDGPYNSVLWKIGSDPREFTARSFTLSFASFLGTLDVNFAAKGAPDRRCFPSDSGVYTVTRPLTVVEQVRKPFVTISPMVGRYKGAFLESPQDSFVVRIEYFDSTKYDAAMTGSKNFYWISNIPKGYVDTTSSPALAYPELRQGMSPEMGYKSLQFGDLGNILKGSGFAMLRKDSLVVYYNHLVTGRRQFVGKRI